MAIDRRGLALRAVFLTVLVGGLLFWTQLRRPRELHLAVDLTASLPGELTSLELIVRRGGHVLSRKELSFGKDGAPGRVDTSIFAAPGAADVELTLTSRAGSRRTEQSVRLADSGEALLHPR